MVISVSDKRDSMVVEVTHRDAATKAVTKDDATIFLTNTTKVFRWGDKDHQLGLDAVTKGERVRVRYTIRDGNKYAGRVVLLPDVRAGRVLEKGTDSFTIKTREGKTLTISVSGATKYWNVVKPKDRQPGSFAALKAGDRVRILGETDKNGTSFDGAAVAYPPADQVTHFSPTVIREPGRKPRLPFFARSPATIGAVEFLAGGDQSREPGDAAETRAKLDRLRQAMEAGGFDAVYLERWANVAWLCGGRGNRVVLDSPVGLCGVVVGLTSVLLVAPNNERTRVEVEAFAGLSLPLIARAWYQVPLWQAAAGRLPAGARWAADVPAEGAADAGPLLDGLRRQLEEPDLARYRALGADAAEALEAALLEVRPGWTELEVAGALAAALKARAIEAPVALVGTRARAERFRHLVPTSEVVEGGLIASVTAVRFGLHASVTRCLSFGEVSPQLSERHAAVVAADQAYLLASRPGGTLGQAFKAGEQAYIDAGLLRGVGGAPPGRDGRVCRPRGVRHRSQSGAGPRGHCPRLEPDRAGSQVRGHGAGAGRRAGVAHPPRRQPGPGSNPRRRRRLAPPRHPRRLTPSPLTTHWVAAAPEPEADVVPLRAEQGVDPPSSAVR